jgi:hypothetical protein
MRLPAFTISLVAGLAGVTAACGVAAAGEAEGFLAQHCLKCHDATKQEGGLRIDTLPRNFSDPVVAGRWADLMTRINAGEMPPEEEPRPTADEIADVVGWIAGNIRAGEAARMAARGPVAICRLSRDEYVHTVYDLLGVRFNARRPGVFNDDPRWHGFESIAAVLPLSPSHVEKYLAAADAVIATAFPESEPKPLKRRADAIRMPDGVEGQRQRLQELGIADKLRNIVLPGESLPGWRTYWAGDMKEPGVYRARIQLSGLRPAGGRAPHLSIPEVYEGDVLAPEDAPTVLEFEAFIPMPTNLDFHNSVPGIPSVNPGNLAMTRIAGWFTHSRDVRRMHPTGYKLFDDDGNPLYPLLIVDWVELEGPIVTDEERARRARFLPADFSDAAAVRDDLRKFCEAAWRRPATDAEVHRYEQIVAAEQAAGKTGRQAYLSALAGVLVSKNFLHLQVGRDPGAGPAEGGAALDDWQLASRLSYFLWQSMPDDDLFAAARAGRLHDPEVLQSQLGRMLADKKIDRFLEAFPRQWLQLHRVGMFPPSKGLYPDYDPWLEKSMLRETTGFFAEVFRENLSIGEFLASDWTIVNPRLAEHYGLPTPPTGEFSRVSLAAEHHRGGLLTQAAVLSLTSDGSRHRPVHRGAWVLETILGTTPPPPPPNVEPLEPTPKDASKMTVRMQLSDHATNATCASCHRTIDPLGFAFENYDAIGRWRTTERVTAGKGDDPPVDASGTLADGRAFTGPEEFKRLLVADEDRFARAFVEQLATFALRRAMTVDDAASLDAIAAAAKADGYRLKSLVEKLVTSDLFLKR